MTLTPKLDAIVATLPVEQIWAELDEIQAEKERLSRRERMLVDLLDEKRALEGKRNAH